MDITDRLKALEDRVASLENRLSSSHGAAPQVHTPGKTTSLRELINKARPSTANDTALLIGYYMETTTGKGYFNNDDLRIGFSQAKIIAPKNFSDIIAKNAKKGYIMGSDEYSSRLKAWVLTNTGEEQVHHMLEGND